MTCEKDKDNCTLAQVKAQEAKYIAERRRIALGPLAKLKKGDDLIGLALSGGGMRSATTAWKISYHRHAGSGPRADWSLQWVRPVLPGL